jgi:hypothetical protein
MIFGTMPRWQRILHSAASIFMAILAGGFGVLSVSFLFRSGPAPSRGLIVSSFAGIVIAACGVGAQFWFRSRLVTEFSYDGRALRSRTLGRAEIETQDLSEIAEVGEWRGRGGPKDIAYVSAVDGRSTSTVCRTR